MANDGNRSPTDPDKIVVKRVVGLEGDRIIPKPVVTWGTDGPTRKVLYPVGMVVPEGHVWVEGDNRDRSRDSNYYGPVSAGLVTGRVVYVLRGWRLVRVVPEVPGRGVVRA